MKKSLIALAFGTLGLGIAEFTMMGILPYVATDLGISIPVAGHFISAYALGVCFGAPMLLLARKRPLKQILLVLMALMIVGNICASMAPNYWVLLLGRFVSDFLMALILGWLPLLRENWLIREKLGGGFNYDSGNDCGQSVWGAVGYFVEPYAVLACHVSAGRCLGIDNIVLHLALGTAGRRSERHGI